MILPQWGEQVYHLLSRGASHGGHSFVCPAYFLFFCVVITALDKATLSTLSDRRAFSCIKFIGKVWPGNPLYPLIHYRVVPISTSVCLRSVQAGPWPQGLNVSQILLVLNINLVNQCSIFVYLSQLVRYTTIQSSNCKRDIKPVV